MLPDPGRDPNEPGRHAAGAPVALGKERHLNARRQGQAGVFQRVGNSLRVQAANALRSRFERDRGDSGQRPFGSSGSADSARLSSRSDPIA